MPNSLTTHFRLARISNLPTAWSNVLCAYLVTGGRDWPALVAGLFAVSFFYIGGMYLNDWRDATHDREHQPERPIPSQMISRKAVFLYAAGYFAAALGISSVVEPSSLWWGVGLMICIAAYDLDHKQNSMSPWVMAACRALIYPWSASLVGEAFTAELWIACAAIYFYTLGLTYIARGPTELKSLRFIFTACVFLPGVVWLSCLDAQSLPAGPVLLLVFLAWTGHSLRGWFSRPPRVGSTVGNLIAGFCLVDLLAICFVLPSSVAILLLFGLLFVGTIKLQTIISGT